MTPTAYQNKLGLIESFFSREKIKNNLLKNLNLAKIVIS